MSILIKGMEMPKTCEECNLESFCNLWVLARGMTTGIPHRATIRHSDCPLIEVSPHGRLIDADALLKSIASTKATSRNAFLVYMLYTVIADAVKNAPTIIEAEGVDG